MAPQRRDFDALECWIVLALIATATNCRMVQGCAFHTVDGAVAESEGVRFIRLREDAEIGRDILKLNAYPRSTIALKAADGSGDHKYFALTELNSTTVVVRLARSLEDLVDRDVPRNLLKFRIMCAGKNEKIEEGSYMSITVYIEDVNDNVPEFLNTPYIVDVEENTSPGTIVFEGIQAFDRDKPNTPNSEVHFSMSTVPEQLSADGSPYFALKSPHRPLLVLKKELDFDNGIRLFKLPLFVWDRGTPANQVNTTITINVRDVDDLPPKFTEGVYRTKMNEFHPMTGILLRIPLYFSPPIMAFDQDSLNASLVYDIISGNERKLFRVNPHNGVMYLQKEIDLEEESLPGNTFVLQIEARQKENPLKKALARIEVEILDLNDNVPEFEADFYNISIVENLPTGFSVLQVNAVDRDQGENAEFIYNLIEEEEAASGAFRIDSRTGWITVRDDRLLDREARSALHLIVEAIERNPPYLSDKKYTKQAIRPSSVKVEITLLDTNDNTPKFERGNLYEFKVSITAPVGHRVGQVVALDPDEGPNGMLLYELQRPKGSGYIPFRLDTKNGTISVSGPLRRGRIAVFVEASDQPTNPSERRFSLAVITIEVYATVDDQAIDFVGAPYEFWVGANAPLGSSVGQVRTTLLYNEAEDDIMYDLLHTYSEGVPFAIEERSGIITVIRELAEFTRKVYYFEAVANYLFTNSTQPLVMARSQSKTAIATAGPELPDEGVLISNVTIHVVTNPEKRVPLRPVIEEINMNIIKFHIEENLVGGIIGQLLYKNGINVVNNELGSFRDLQSSSAVNSNMTIGARYRSHSRSQRQQSRRRRLPRRLVGDTNNIKLRYIIANQQEVVNKISITEDGTLLTLLGLDREQKDSYDLTVIVEYTTGLLSGAGIYQVNIKVDDVNDNAPKFNVHTYVGLINENSAAGTEVAINQAIQISDADEGLNADFRVVLQGDYSDLFAIEFFGGNGSATGAAGIANRNEHSQQSLATTAAPSQAFFNVFNLTEQWNDELQFADMQTMLQRSSLKSNAYFRIRYTGKQPLDREKDQLYRLKVIAIDTGGLSGYAMLNVLIADVNDNAPIFERVSVFKDSKLEIREYTTDMEIYFVESAANAQSPTMPSAIAMPPYLIPGSPRLNFEMAFNDTYETMMQPRLRPRARGRSRMRLVRAAPLKCPLFAIHEDTPLTTKVLQVTASDEDYGKNALVHYEIASELVERPIGAQIQPRVHGVKHFAIDKLSGELMVNYPLAANVEVFLNLSATDIDGLKDTTCLRFTVIDVNNHAPAFKKSWYSFDTAEGDYQESVLGQVLAVDLDYGMNANITYSLSQTDVPFHIKPMSGVIKIVAPLDREVRAKYDFQVIATDNAEPLYRMSSSVDVEVNVLDVNDNRPEFIGYDDMVKADQYLLDRSIEVVPVYKAYLDRNTKPGMFVKQVTAIDKDDVGNGNGLVLYTILHQDIHSPIVQIDTRDGTITTMAHFQSYNDYEHLTVTVVASDLGSPSHSSTAIVLINLQGQAATEEPTSSTTTTTLAPTTTEEKPDQQNATTLFHHQYYEVQLLENNETPTELVRLNLTAGLSTDAYRWSVQLEEARSTYNDNDVEEVAHHAFEFDAKGGTLYALKSFDRESVWRYQLRLRADKPNREGRTYARIAYPVLDERIEDLEANECRIVVHVLDENDNSPKFVGNGRPIVAVVPRSATFGYPITRVQATDPDDGVNAAVRYRLLNEPSRLFAVDELSGRIRLVASVPMDERVYGFDVKATDRDGADDGRSGIVNVFVYVIDEGRQVRVVVAGRPVEVERRIEALMSVLSDAIQMDVRVRLLEPHAGGLEPATDAYIYAVDFRTNAIMEMEQLQNALASLQLDTLQLQQQQQQPQQQQHTHATTDSASMPRIIELAEFGQFAHNGNNGAAVFLSGLEIISIVLLVLCGIGAAMTALCFLCMRQKRGAWSQPEFPSSETGLTYAIARAGIASCRRQHHNRKQRQQLRLLRSEFAPTATTRSPLPESVCSSAKTQSTAVATQKLDQQQTQQSHQHHSHSHHHHAQQQKQQHHHQNNDQRQREYIDVPLPKSVAKGAINRCASLDPDPTMSSPFVLKYNASQPVNNLSRSPNAYETSMFSLHSNSGQDSGVDFLSSRELYETSPDSFNLSQSSQKCTSIAHSQQLCPRHAKEQGVTEAKHHSSSVMSLSGALVSVATDSSDNYEDSLKNDKPLVAFNCRNNIAATTPCQHRHRHDYQNTKFEKRTSCVRHSFSGVKDDLVQSSPQISLRPRGHMLRNSMNDLEERLHNLEQSFRRPTPLGKSNSIF